MIVETNFLAFIVISWMCKKKIMQFSLVCMSLRILLRR